jgi:Na+-driven multidrug efflux pump
LLPLPLPALVYYLPWFFCQVGLDSILALFPDFWQLWRTRMMKTAFYVSLVGWFAVRLSVTYLFAFVFNLGLLGVWLGSTCDWIVRSIVLG